MYREYHEIPYNSHIKEAIIGPFSGSQLIWLAPSVYLSYWMSQNVPKLPLDSYVLNKLHWFLPMVIAILFVSFKVPKTNLTLLQHVIVITKFKSRQRVFRYKRSKIPNLKRGAKK